MADTSFNFGVNAKPKKAAAFRGNKAAPPRPKVVNYAKFKRAVAFRRGGAGSGGA
jgi:hypothetical protein